ncbi:YgaC family protein [Escherichia coli]|uniref:YgaC family protein n=1 Tax=Escherichia coli TaxID=562 RepID=UPI001FCE6AAB|nr:YgaC family protein [Escherichia coli]
MIRCVCGKKIGPDPRNFNQRVSLGRNDLLIRTFLNREARMGRTALVIHPTLKERSSTLAEPASDIKTCDHYQQFPLYLAGERHEHYGIPHGFSSRVALERYLNGLFGEAS